MGFGFLESVYEKGDNMVNCMQIADSKTHIRRFQLKSYAIQKFKMSNHCQILVSVATRAIHLVNGLNNPADTLVNDLEAVLIGSDMRHCRSKEPYFAGHILGSSGFKKELRDPYNQVQHATAGIVIGYRYGWIGQQFAKWLEEEAQDDRLYDATCLIGRSLNDNNYFALPARIKAAIGDKTC